MTSVFDWRGPSTCFAPDPAKTRQENANQAAADKRKVNGRGADPYGRRGPLPKVDAAAIRELRAKGATWDEVAAKLDCNEATARRRLRQDDKRNAL